MNLSYRRGLSILVGTLLWAVVLQRSWALFGPTNDARAPRNFSEVTGPVAPFRFTERSGREITDADLADQVWVAGFIFTRCPSACPKISATMKSLQESFRDTGIRLVSITVDPEHDTPEILARYAEGYGADADRWLFFNGPKAETYDFIKKKLLQAVDQASEEEVADGSDPILHSQRLVLIDRGNRPLYHFDTTQPGEVQSLRDRAIQLDATGPSSWVRQLPAWNASLNGLCTILLIAGWLFIRSGRTTPHIVCMASAVVVSAIFLGCYLVYHARVGSVPFRGVGLIRPVYFTVLLSHTILAVVMVPMIVMTLLRGIRKQYEAHARIAAMTWPIWVYVSITGVLIYLMLYQLPTAPLAIGA